LKKLNFIYGANGTGKTTIGRLIDKPEQFQECNVAWENGIEMGALVYNRDFVDRNFNQKIPGVFTLGEAQVDTLEKIEAAKSQIAQLKKDIAGLTGTLQGDDGNSGKRRELAQLENTYNDQFWQAKQKYENKLAGGLRGSMGSKGSFKGKALAESRTDNAELLPLVSLEESTKKVFSDTLERVQKIAMIQSETLLFLERAPILEKIVIGKEDVDIAAMYKKLNNSDWVHQGLAYFSANNGLCPFCQQETEKHFAKSLGKYFDKAFEQDNAAIDTLIASYSAESNKIKQQLQVLIDQNSEFVDNEKLEREKTLLDSLIEANMRHPTQKKKEASQAVKLNSLKNTLDTIGTLLSVANEKIDKHNAIFDHLEREKGTLTAQIWKFIIDELKNDIANYKEKQTGLTAAIASLEERIGSKKSELQTKEKELGVLGKQTVSTQPTLDSINRSLESFGFRSFRLASSTDGHLYRLVRESGADAQETLSEGERNFVTFLYFFYLLKGSQAETGINTDKVVVFDDPVSSLDSDVLFIVSTLIRELFFEMQQRGGPIKQIFVLTHSIYFHKEVTYTPSHKQNELKEKIGFWIIKKRSLISLIEKQASNPIKTTYEVRSAKTADNNVTLRNTLRRILESYFKWLGDHSLEELHQEFEGDEKIVCKSLCSWLHAGSHDAFHDEHDTTWDSTDAERGLETFKKIFEKRGQVGHYNRMMKLQPEE